MRRGWRTPIAASVLVAAAASVCPGAACADMMVVRAAGGGLTAGQTVPSGSRVTLPAGATATLVSEDGRVVSLTGPYAGAPDASLNRAASESKEPSVLSRLLTPRTTETNSLGVIRGSSHVLDPAAADPNGAGKGNQFRK